MPTVLYEFTTELDTGSAFSIVSEHTRKDIFPNLRLHKSSILLKTYTDERIFVLGELHVHMQYGSQKARLVLLVVDGNGPSLLGRNWLRHVRLDWKSICAVSHDTSNTPQPAPLHPWIWPTKPWQRIHIDFAGPFLDRHFLVVVDAHSKWPEVFEMQSASTAKTIAVLRHLFAAYMVCQSRWCQTMAPNSRRKSSKPL